MVISLTELIESKFNVVSETEEFNLVFKQSLLCLTKAIGAFAFQHSVKQVSKNRSNRKDVLSAKDFRLSFFNHYFGISLKLFTLRLGKYKSVSQDIVKGLAAEYKVKRCDAIRVYRLWKSDRSFRVAIKKESGKFAKTSNQWSETELSKLFCMMEPKLRAYAKRFVRLKLRFVAKSNNIPFDDLVNEVMCHVWQRFCYLVPSDREPLHLLNTLKTSIVNAVNNMCDEYTSQKNGRLVGDGKDSFSLIVVSENQLNNVDESGDELGYDSLASSNPFTKLELSMSVEQVVHKTKSSKQVRLLFILMGRYDEEFTLWLRNIGVCNAVDDNTDLQVNMQPRNFNRLLSRFLKVPFDKTDSYLSRVGKQIAPEVNRGLNRAAA